MGGPDRSTCWRCWRAGRQPCAFPDTGEIVPLFQIVPSKNNEERLLLVSPELASVLATIVTRLRDSHNGTVPLTGLRDDLGTPPHDFRRIFATEAVTSGLPVHIGARLLGHASLDTTQAHVAVFQDDLVRTYRAFLAQRRAIRPAEEYRVATDQEWTEFQQHFHARKLELGTCGRPYGSSCQHEHACIRCPVLHVDPADVPGWSRSRITSETDL
ncbi:site-specific integrase [Amycolatopsis sp. WAC 01376]|uniref:site-specific integrase n=1 Tax=Amycolatopsis sp. WAC 01376 TaxID=2203195 RepID=UPI0018F4E049|nr:site-specific integrase [Amycolatopsis sp. WAC 01376]